MKHLELTPIAEVFVDRVSFTDLHAGYAVLEDDREVNFTYDSYAKVFLQLDDERYTKQIKDEINRLAAERQDAELTDYDKN